MSRVSVLCIAVFAVLPILAVSQCDIDDENCRDRFMHPDFPSSADGNQHRKQEENANEYWISKGKEFVRQKLNSRINTNRAKNVIMFLGDGMSLTTIAAARNVIGGEEQQLSFEDFPFTGLSKTYSVDKIVPDSACTSTAYLCGVKAQEGTIGLSGNVYYSDCESSKNKSNHVHSIANWAMAAGKWAGVVTTTRITHASPAGVYAHVADREWEDDTIVRTSCGASSGVEDIAQQLIQGETGSKLKLMMGGGRQHLKESRSDGRDLIEEYKSQSTRNVFITTRSELMEKDLSQADRVMGLFQDSHMLYHLETNDTTDQPTLEEMTRKAIEFLSRSNEGYFIFIEGGRIDLAHHDNMARIALDETAEFSKAIKAARDMTNEDDTLIVVTADHSHAFSFSGYSYRGGDIFGRTPAEAEDKLPLMTLSYANGPSYKKFYDTKNFRRLNPLEVLTGEAHDQFPATWPLDMETHGGDDVAVYASGPWSHLFTGVYEQNTIPHIMAFAACMGDGLTACNS